MATKKTATKKTAAKKTAAKKTAASTQAPAKKKAAPAAKKTTAKATTKTTAKATTKTTAKATTKTTAPTKKTATTKAPKLAMKTWNGSCHCGKVRYTVESDLSGAVTCNCSICQRAGYVLTFVGATQFKLLSGDKAQTDYQFNKKHIHHLFCKTCGVRSYSWGVGPDGNKTFSVNIRCLEGVDLASLATLAYDGASM